MGEKLVSSIAFELIFGVLIVLNTVIVCLEAEYRGVGRGHQLGIRGRWPTTATTDTAFRVIQIIVVPTGFYDHKTVPSEFFRRFGALFHIGLPPQCDVSVRPPRNLWSDKVKVEPGLNP